MPRSGDVVADHGDADPEVVDRGEMVLPESLYASFANRAINAVSNGSASWLVGLYALVMIVTLSDSGTRGRT
jgi:hypothetical protein